jgi:NTE family protein
MRQLPYARIALVLQGGGALGSYQAGVLEGLEEAGIQPNWIAGISIGALNTAIIAGNPPGQRVEKLRAFWEEICMPAYFAPIPSAMLDFVSHSQGDVRRAFSAFDAFRALFEGQRGFFVPRMPPAMLVTHTDPSTTSYYDTKPLKATLEKFADFDRINAREVRVSVGAVNVRTGNFVYFDNTDERHGPLRPEHFMASGALPASQLSCDRDRRRVLLGTNFGFPDFPHHDLKVVWEDEERGGWTGPLVLPQSMRERSNCS